MSAQMVKQVGRHRGEKSAIWFTRVLRELADGELTEVLRIFHLVLFCFVARARQILEQLRGSKHER
jgi:hypothetical protein